MPEASATASSAADPEGFDIARKPPDKVRAMSQTVYDNDFVVDEMTDAGWPLRWQPLSVGKAAQTADWKSPDGGRSYVIESVKPDAAKTDAAKESGQHDAWIRYQHFIPFGADWDDINENHRVRPPRSRLITDFYAYNSGEVFGGSSIDSQMADELGRRSGAGSHDQRAKCGRDDPARSGPRGPTRPLRDRPGVGRGAAQHGRPERLSTQSQDGGSAARAGIELRLPTSIGNCCCGSTASP